MIIVNETPDMKIVREIDYSSIRDRVLELESEMDDIQKRALGGNLSFSEAQRIQSRTDAINSEIQSITDDVANASAAFRKLRSDLTKACEQSLKTGKLICPSLSLDCSIGHAELVVFTEHHKVNQRSATLNHLRVALAVVRTSPGSRHEKNQHLIQLDRLVNETIRDLAESFDDLVERGTEVIWPLFAVPRLLDERQESLLVWLALSDPEMAALAVGNPGALQTSGSLSLFMMGVIMNMNSENLMFRESVHSYILQYDPNKVQKDGMQIYRQLGVLLNDDFMAEHTIESVLRGDLGGNARLQRTELDGSELEALAVEAGLPVANIDWDALATTRDQYLSVCYVMIKQRPPTEVEVQLRTMLQGGI
jgi:hypothetical protein